MEERDLSVKTFSKYILVLCGFILLSYSLVLVRQVILTAVIGIIFAIIIRPAISFIERKLNIKKGFATSLVFLGIILLLGAIISGFSFFSYQQFQKFIKDLPELWASIEKIVHTKLSEWGLYSKTLDQVQENIPVKEAFTGVIKSFQIGAKSMASTFLAIVIMFYLSLNAEFYKKQVLILFPCEKKDKVNEELSNLAHTIRGWFTAQIIDVFFVFLLTSIGLLIVGFKYWLVLGLMCGFLCLIPYVGILISTILACLIVMAQDSTLLPWVLGVFLITQQIEGNFILPKLMKERINLPEVPLILFMSCMGIWFGLLGLLIAPPILGCLISLINVFREEGRKIMR